MAGVTFNERMDGFLSPCNAQPNDRRDYEVGFQQARAAGRPCYFTATMIMEDIASYVRDPAHLARMTGSFQWTGPDPIPMRNGEFQLYAKNPETGIREMKYRFDFTTAAGEQLSFSGVKWMRPKARINTWSPSTTLYSQVTRSDGEVVSCGILKIGFKETAKLFRSLRPINATDKSEGRKAVLAFNRFFMGEQVGMLRDG